MEIPFRLVDVFTERALAGNQLCVVPEPVDGLDAERMQAVAREIGFSETTFVTETAGDRYSMRIFTPGTELPFAGHPSVGAAVTSVRRGLAAPGRVIQECGAGSLPIDVTDTGAATLTGGTPTLGPELDPGPLLSLVGLAAGDLAPGGSPRRAGCGLEFTYLPVRRSALAHSWADAATAAKLDVPQISVFAWDPGQRSAYARVFCPGPGVPEDPATGSAALGLGVWLVAAGWLPAGGVSSYTVHQGIEMHRPSLLECTVTAAAGAATAATVSGHVVPIAHGEITVPPFLG